MPPNTTKIEANIAAASAAMDANPRLKATRQFKVPYRRLLRRRQGMPPSNSRGGHNKKLSTVQDTALKEYIFMLYSCGTPANIETTKIAANRLLFYSTSDSSITVSKRWVRAWVARHSDFLKPLKTKPISAKRLESHVVEEIQAHLPFTEFYTQFLLHVAGRAKIPEDIRLAQ
jgi:hypothetical protein